MYLINNEKYISAIALTYAISSKDEINVRKLFEDMIENTSSVDLKSLNYPKALSPLLSIKEHKIYFYFCGVLLLFKKQNNAIKYGVRIEKLYRELFPDIYGLVKKQKEFNRNDFLFLFNESEGLTLTRKLIFSNRIVALMFFILNKWGVENKNAREFGESLFRIVLDDKQHDVESTFVEKPSQESVNAEMEKVNSFFADEQKELCFDDIYRIHGMDFDKMYYNYGENAQVIENTFIIKQLLNMQLKEEKIIIDFLSYNLSILFSFIKEATHFMEETDIFLDKHMINRMEKDVETANRENIAIRRKNESVLKQKEEVLSNLVRDNERKDKRIDKLCEELLKQKEQMKELVALRNYIYNLHDEMIEQADEQEEWSLINDKKGVIVGGSDIWQKRIREKLPSWSYVSAAINSIDKNLFTNIEYVFVNTSFIGHSKYYGIVSIVQSNECQMGFINSYNINRVYKELSNQIFKK